MLGSIYSEECPSKCPHRHKRSGGTSLIQSVRLEVYWDTPRWTLSSVWRCRLRTVCRVDRILQHSRSWCCYLWGHQTLRSVGLPGVFWSLASDVYGQELTFCFVTQEVPLELFRKRCRARTISFRSDTRLNNRSAVNPLFPANRKRPQHEENPPPGVFLFLYVIIFLLLPPSFSHTTLLLLTHTERFGGPWSFFFLFLLASQDSRISQKKIRALLKGGFGLQTISAHFARPNERLAADRGGCSWPRFESRKSTKKTIFFSTTGWKI